MNFQESETVELKSIVVDDIKKEIIAFANCEGGILYIGVQDDGTVLGVDDPDETALRISNMVRDAIKPDLTMFLHYETIDVGKRVGNFYTKRSGKAIRYQSDIVWTADKTDDRKRRDRSGGKRKKYTLSARTAE